MYCFLIIIQRLPKVGQPKDKLIFEIILSAVCLAKVVPEWLLLQYIPLATTSKALGHPARIAILEYLLKVNKCICCDIVDKLPLAQPTVSQHLKQLKDAGLIKGNIEGNSVCYCINEETLSMFEFYFETMTTKLKKQNCC